ncbi:hypothetical protein Tsubulata_049263, partial [Turnera subulata]
MDFPWKWHTSLVGNGNGGGKKWRERISTVHFTEEEPVEAKTKKELICYIILLLHELNELI